MFFLADVSLTGGSFSSNSSLNLTAGADLTLSGSVLNISGALTVESQSTLSLSNLQSNSIIHGSLLNKPLRSQLTPLIGDLILQQGSSLEVNLSSASTPLLITGCLNVSDSSLTIGVPLGSTTGAPGSQSVNLFQTQICNSSMTLANPNVFVIDGSQCLNPTSPALVASSQNYLLVTFNLQEKCNARSLAPLTVLLGLLFLLSL